MKLFKYYVILLLTFSMSIPSISENNDSFIKYSKNISKSTEFTRFEKIKCSYNNLSPLKKKLVTGISIFFTCCVTGTVIYFLYKNNKINFKNRDINKVKYRYYGSNKQKKLSKGKGRESRIILGKDMANAASMANMSGISWTPAEYYGIDGILEENTWCYYNDLKLITPLSVPPKYSLKKIF